MKKFVQISLILILVTTLLQASFDGSMARNISVKTNTLHQDAQFVTCLGVKGLICIKPNVGWNS